MDYKDKAFRYLESEGTCNDCADYDKCGIKDANHCSGFFPSGEAIDRVMANMISEEQHD